MTNAGTPKNIQKGIVKQIISGDTIVLRGQPKGGPPPERTVCLSNITAPKLARRANPNAPGVTETKDEPYAWEAREFLRKKCIGKEVSFTVEYQVPGTGREYGCIYLGKDTKSENVTESLIREGLVTVRRGGLRMNDDEQQRLVVLEDEAKEANIGIHNTTEAAKHVRKIKWSLDNVKNFVDSFHNKPVEAIIEHVRDGCTVRAFLLPSFHHVTIMLSGIKAPMFKLDGDRVTPEPFAEEARYFTESRLLQRELKIILEGVSNQNILGTILHPKGNISHLLLNEGLARCVDWSIGVVTEGPEKLRAAEKVAKDKNLRIWKEYKPPQINMAGKKSFNAQVVEIVNGDAMIVKPDDGTPKKIFLASVRPPRAADNTDKQVTKGRSRPLYDIPYMFEAREFMRTKLIGKTVNVHVDYIQPPAQGFPEKTCCTVKFSNINIGEALISKGYARVIRYRQDDDQRSSHYDTLLTAESKAEKNGVGLHSSKEYAFHRVADVTGDKAKSFLSFLKRAGRCSGIVEFVASGSRMRIYIPKETCLITLLLAGIDCPRGSRPGLKGESIPAEPYGESALAYTKELTIQQEVELEVDSIDKGGNFIGWLFVNGTNLSISLVEKGLSKVHFTAERSNHYSTLCTAEENAKSLKLNIWEDYVEQKEISIEEDSQTEKSSGFKNVIITEITDDLHFYAQEVENGPKLEKLTEDLRSEFESHTPVPGAYHPKKGDICAARYTVDNQWYRAKIEKVESQHSVELLFIDYGNSEIVDTTSLAALPTSCQGLSAQAKEYLLAYVVIPSDEEDLQEAVEALKQDILNKECSLKVEYTTTKTCVTLHFTESSTDVGMQLVAEGLLTVDNRRERSLANTVAKYHKAQTKAKAERLNLWKYGDITQDDAREFGYQK